MDINYILLLALFSMALLYSSVGHGGASGYLAVMAIFGIMPTTMKSSALVLNLFVSLISFAQFYKKGSFKTTLFFQLAIASVPFAYLGAQIPISDNVYKKILAICILISLFRIFIKQKEIVSPLITPNLYINLVIGMLIGLLSGMLGIGGGIILTPILLLMGWATLKEAAPISALFIFVNSISGLIGLLNKGYTFDNQTYSWIIVAVIGGILGGYLGSKKYNLVTMTYVLGFVLIIACGKLLIT